MRRVVKMRGVVKMRKVVKMRREAQHQHMRIGMDGMPVRMEC